MRIWPVLLDCEPPYLQRLGGSLLQMPMGRDVLATRLSDRVRALTANAPVILPPPRAGAEYRAAMAAACPGATVLAAGQQLIDVLPPLETSDVFLFIDPRCLPLDGAGMVAMLNRCKGSRMVAHHLVAFETSVAGTKEHVTVDGGGRVRSIHRYYEPATWPFITGVAASLVPVSSSLGYLEPLPESLVELRRHLVMSGAPCRDVAIKDGALDLTTSHGLLAATEQSVIDDTGHGATGGRPSPLLVGGGHSIASSARIIGPVVIHPGVHIGEDVTIVGPALIGEGAQVSARAVVAHAVVGPHSQVPPDCTIRDRVWFNSLDHADEDRPEPSYQERLERFGFDPDATSAISAVTSVSPSWPRWKRLFDVVASGIGIVLLAPVYLMVAILIRLESRGPILYRGEREGLGGRPFECLKFRTMQEGAHGIQHLLKAQDKLDGPHFKLDGDPRLTAVGRVLRALNVDELPQLFNVLRGDMSLVGPRPSPFRENQICVPWREGRLSVRPGVTGLWQICRKDRSSGDFHQWIEYDLLYVQQVSPWLDLKILLATVFTLAGRVPVPAVWMVRLPPPVPGLPASADAAEAAAGRQTATEAEVARPTRRWSRSL
jgi:lipopolysaccharide/colanic/teichoic acid biosynthesis glycosyltransferase